MRGKDIQNKIEELSEQLVFAEPGDATSLLGCQRLLEDIAHWAEAAQEDKMVEACIQGIKISRTAVGWRAR